MHKLFVVLIGSCHENSHQQIYVGCSHFRRQLLAVFVDMSKLFQSAVMWIVSPLGDEYDTFRCIILAHGERCGA